MSHPSRRSRRRNRPKRIANRQRVKAIVLYLSQSLFNVGNPCLIDIKEVTPSHPLSDILIDRRLGLRCFIATTSSLNIEPVANPPYSALACSFFDSEVKTSNYKKPSTVTNLGLIHSWIAKTNRFNLDEIRNLGEHLPHLRIS